MANLTMATLPTFNVVSNPHPLLGDGRVYYKAPPKWGETLGDYVKRVGVALPRGHSVVIVNGQITKDWRAHLFQPGDDVIFKASARGGMDSDTAKVVRIVAMLALTAIAVATAGAAVAALGIAGTVAGTIVNGLVMSAVMVGGQLLINALLPPVQSANSEDLSPSYAIRGGRNQVNPYGPMQIVFGWHRVVPYLGSAPYITFKGNDQYLSQVFHFGLQHDLEFKEIRIGQSPLSSYKDVEREFSGYDGGLSLVPGNVDVLEGFELKKPNSSVRDDDNWTVRKTPLDTTLISVDVGASLYRRDDGRDVNNTVRFQIQYRPAGRGNWLPLSVTAPTPEGYWSLGKTVGGNASAQASAAGVNAPVRLDGGWLQMRYGSTVRSDHQDGDKERVCHNEVRTDSNGRPRTVQVCDEYTWKWRPYPEHWEGVAPSPTLPTTGDGTASLTHYDSRKPKLHTYSVQVPAGQYEIRARKLSVDEESTTASNALRITQIRCVQTDTADYTGQCRLALRVKASSQLNGTIDTLNATVFGKYPVWRNGAWRLEKTSNPAWLYLWWARGKRDANYRRLYGECLPDGRIDIEGIKEWARWCDRKKLYFNWVLDRKMSIEDVFTRIARAGRASTTWHTGKRGVIFDSDNKPVSTLLTPANIVAGSLSYKVINAELADEIIVNFYNENKNHERDSVRQRVPNAVYSNNPATLEIDGCTNANQAGREANLLAASQYFHRKRYSFEMDIEGAVLLRGDVAQLTHDLTSFSAGGRLVGVEGNTLIIDSDVGQRNNAWASVRSPSGAVRYIRVNANGNRLTPVSVREGNRNSSTDWKGGEAVDNPQDWIWQYDPQETPGVKLQIVSAVPQQNGNVRFEAIEYCKAYYDAENALYRHVEPKAFRDLNPLRVESLNVRERVINRQTGRTELTIGWALNDVANVKVDIYKGEALIQSERQQGNSTTVEANEGDVLRIVVSPFAPNRGTQEHDSNYTVIGSRVALSAPQQVRLDGHFGNNTVRFRWNAVANVSQGYEIRIQQGNRTLRTENVGDVLHYEYRRERWSTDGLIGRTVSFSVRAMGERGNASPWSAVATASKAQVGQVDRLTVNHGENHIAAEASAVDGATGYLWWVSADANFRPTADNATHESNSRHTSIPLRANGRNTIDPYTTLYVWTAAFDAFGKDGIRLSQQVQLSAKTNQGGSVGGELYPQGTQTATGSSSSLTIDLGLIEHRVLGEFFTVKASVNRFLGQQYPQKTYYMVLFLNDAVECFWSIAPEKEDLYVRGGDPVHYEKRTRENSPLCWGTDKHGFKEHFHRCRHGDGVFLATETVHSPPPEGANFGRAPVDKQVTFTLRLYERDGRHAPLYPNGVDRVGLLGAGNIDPRGGRLSQNRTILPDFVTQQLPTLTPRKGGMTLQVTHTIPDHIGLELS